MALRGAQRLGAVGLFLRVVAAVGRPRDGLAQFLRAEFLERRSEIRFVEVEEGADLRAQFVDPPVPRIRLVRAVALDQVVDRVAGDSRDVLAPFAAEQDVAAQLVDRLALLVHHVVVLEQVLADLEVPALHLRLGALDRPVHHRRLDRHALLHAQALHQGLDTVRSENPHQVVLERKVEAGGAGIALAPGAAAELVVDPPRLVSFGAEDVHAAGGDDLFPFGRAQLPVAGEGFGKALRVLRFVGLGPGQLLRVAAQDDVRAAPGHVRGDRHRAAAAGLGDDRRLAFVVLRVEDDVLDPGALEQPRQHLAVLDRHRADEHRLASFPTVLDLLDHRLPFLRRGAVDEVRTIVPDHWLVGRGDHDVEAVDLAELAGFRVRGAGHARQLAVHAEVVLEGDRRQRLVLALDPHAFLRLDRLVEAVGPAAARHLAPGELVDDHDLAVLHQVLDVAPVEVVRAQSLVHRVQHLHVLHLEQVADAEQLLDLGRAFVGQGGGVRLLVADEVAGRVLAVALAHLLAALEPGDDPVDQGVLLGRLLGRTGDDQRRSRLVDEDRVHLVDDGEVVAALDHGLQRELHVVAQVVEAEFVVRAVGDVRAVGGLAFAVGQSVLDDADLEAEEPVDLAHPLGVAARQVVVHGDDVDALAEQGVEVDGQGGDEGLALAGLHLRDLALVQDDAAHQLHVVVAHPQGAHRGLADGGEGRHEEVFQVLPPVQPVAELGGARPQAIVRQRLQFGLQRVDRVDPRLEPLEIAVVLAAEELGDRPGDHDALNVGPGGGAGAAPRCGLGFRPAFPWPPRAASPGFAGTRTGCAGRLPAGPRSAGGSPWPGRSCRPGPRRRRG